jgi:long-chain fatty acid transport protein
MFTRHLTIAFAASALIGAAAPIASATDGHFLHGVGAINSAMGGAGVASSPSILGAFYLNPAGLHSFNGSRVEISFEMFKADRSVASAVGPFSGSTTSASNISAIPAFGFSQSSSDGKIVFGLGALGVGGFGVDYPSDMANPILMPQPNGFGNLYSSFQLLKIIPTVSFSLSPKLFLGVAANVDWASLAVDPMPTAPPAFSAAPPAAFYSGATHAGGAYGVGAQIGLQYQVSDAFALGLAWTSEQSFQAFKYNSTYANPYLPNYNTARTIEFTLDAPAIWAAGISVKPSKSLLALVDARYITYAETPGFKGTGFNPDGSVNGFGWQNIWVVALGLQWQASPAFTLRGGYNYTQNPVPSSLEMINAAAPAIVQQHVTLGLGYAFSDGLELDAGYYHAFSNSGTGQLLTPAGAIAGSSVTNTLSENSFLLQFTITHGRNP